MRVGILASGEGTNFQALLDACRAGYAPAEIAVVLSSRAEAGVLRRASRAGIEAVFVDPKGASSREDYDTQLAAYLEKHGVDFVCGAGYLRLLSAEFVRAYENRILNVHPSLLPAFPGLHAVRQAFEWRAKVTGVTVHVIDAELDHGPIVLQRAVDVRPDDTLAALEARVHLTEYAIYPKALKLFAEGRVKIEGRTVLITHDVEDPPWNGQLAPGLRGGA
jgi:phosphoribosylglycinamide formyltransferase-1